MPRDSRRFLLISLAILIFCPFFNPSVLAQSASDARLTAPDTSEFPHLVARLDVHDPSGAFVHGLTPQDVTLQENGLLVPVAELQEQKPGVQFVIAVSSGESFAIRDGLGVSRYEYLLQGLLTGVWAYASPGGDDFSLITLGGPQVIHSSDPGAVRASLVEYVPADPQAHPTLEVLASALQVASDPLNRPGMERAILFITPPQGNEVSLGLQSIIESAAQQDIRIFVWLVASPEVFNLPEIDLLRNLATQTHATFFAFSHDEPIPDLETMLEPLRYVYQLGYQSQVAAPGAQQVSAQVLVRGELVTTQPQSFELDLQPPAPTLLDLPGVIARVFSGTPAPGDANAEADFVPSLQVIDIQVAFPDGFERPLARTSLYVDGALYAENTAPPLNRFVWDLRVYTQDGDHTLSIEAVDSLGISGRSTDSSVKITVPTTTQGVLVAISQKKPMLVGVVVLISASILVLVLILGGRIHPKPHPGQVRGVAGSTEKTRPAGLRERMRQRKDPLTQPVKIASLPPAQVRPRTKSLGERLPWLKRREKPAPALAYLIPLVGTDETTLPAPFQINTHDITLGRDASQASLVITDPSLEGLHARIHHEGDRFLITDAGSVAGTWVNYEPVPPTGAYLEHADIIHLGAVGFRFTLAEPGQPRKVVVTPLETGK
ncbi:MAG: hypothetical protein A2136_08660 [Chloroflexi bacterium RBG_16_54_11]|nr:MAG: hypothetical protein A2136_08660 [Chloroflexi bacterium RBG_16_54_11]